MKKEKRHFGLIQSAQAAKPKDTTDATPILVEITKPLYGGQFLARKMCIRDRKYAVQCGGGTNHRIDLASGILIKNNHISLGGGLPAVLTAALKNRRKGQRIEVEVRTAARCV